MQGPIRCAVIALFAACGGGDITVDARVLGPGGVIVEWSSQPLTWPADLGNGLVLDRANFAFDSLRVVGDAGPGDPRTTASAFVLRWDAATKPPDIPFAEAPAGVYSQVSIVIDGKGVQLASELRGRVFLDSTEWEFRIEDDSPVTMTIPIEANHVPPQTVYLRARVIFQRLLGGLDFRMFPQQEGRLQLSTGDPQMTAFRAQLVSSIEVVN